MEKEAARDQFNEMTKRLGLIHTFTFDEAWDFVMYKKQQDLIHNPSSFIPASYSKEEFKGMITDIEKRMRETPGSLVGEELNKANPLHHSFGEGCYVREIFNPKGMLLVTKIHKIAHPFFLLSGEMSILTETGEKRIKAPHYGITPAGTKRIIYAHEDCVFVTVHVTNETDLEKIEDEIISKSFEDFEQYKNSHKQIIEVKSKG
jgi:hypothetical protein